MYETKSIMKEKEWYADNLQLDVKSLLIFLMEGIYLDENHCVIFKADPLSSVLPCVFNSLLTIMYRNIELNLLI